MSRSTRRTPIVAHAHAAKSDKPGKRAANKALRARVRSASWTDAPPLLREVSNVYLFPKPGKRYVKATPELLRK